MKVSVRPLNTGETFCCSIKSAKSIFQSTEIHLNFSFFGRDYGTFSETPDAYYFKNNIKGRIIASLYAHSNSEHSILSFYVLKQSSFSQELKNEFESSYLPWFYNHYKAQLSINDISDKAKMMLVELYNGKLIPHVKVIR